MKVELSDALGIAAARWFEELDDRGVFITDERLVVRRWNHWLAAQTGRTCADTSGNRSSRSIPRWSSAASTAATATRRRRVRILSERFHKFLLPSTPTSTAPGSPEMSQSARIDRSGTANAVIGTIT